MNGMAPLAALALVLQSHEEAKLVAGDGFPHDYFGVAVSVFGERVLVGAQGDDDSGPGSGAAYVFARSASGAWLPEARLVAADSGPELVFGASVALFGDRALVGAPGTGGVSHYGTGAAHVFERQADGTWVEQAKLVASDADDLDYFGVSVALFGDRALIGAFLRLPPVTVESHVLDRRLDLTAPPLLGNLVAGSTWNIQAAFRDAAAGGFLFDTSSAIAVAFVP